MKGDKSMTITAKYPGKCTKCGGSIKPGEKIEWEKGKGAYHVKCEAEPAMMSGEKTYKLSGGSGYGCRGWDRGQVLRNAAKRIEQGEPEFLFVISASSRRVYEDGLSFGVGDEEGYLYCATAREATAEEAAPVRARIAERDEAARKTKALAEMVEKIHDEGECPEGEHRPEGDRVNIGQGQTLYGGGEWFIVGPEYIWHVRNNGMDGDDWSRNNVRTGGAGAIGWRIPTTPELIKFFKSYDIAK